MFDCIPESGMIGEQMIINGRPTWAEIDLDALANNYRIIRYTVGKDVQLLAAVKADAYGHGAVECSRRLQLEGVNWFGVALPEEGIELRQAGIALPILCLGGFWKGEDRACLQYQLTPIVYRRDMIESLDRAARDASVVADVHVKIDTGMGRLGFRSVEVSELVDELRRFKNIRVEGIMTHLAAADDSAKNEFTGRQLEEFEHAVNTFRERGIRPRYVHAANSAATFAHPRARGNIVRPGGTLYGFCDDVLPAEIDKPPFSPVMSVRSRIMLLKDVPKGEHLGYGCTFQTVRDSIIATLPIGYADGYCRALGNLGRAIVRGQFAPVVGRVSMDLTLLDVTDVPGVALDDQVTMLGSEGNSRITAEDLGQLAGTISYEITCGISSRVPRFYQSK